MQAIKELVPLELAQARLFAKCIIFRAQFCARCTIFPLKQIVAFSVRKMRQHAAFFQWKRARAYAEKLYTDAGALQPCWLLQDYLPLKR
jgi:hypothetical protein